MLPRMFKSFTFEPLHNLHLSIPETLKKTVIGCLSPETVPTNLRNTPNKQRPLIQGRIVVLLGCSTYLTTAAKDGGDI